MSDIKLFKINGSKVAELEGKAVAVEKKLQALIERHLEEFLGVRFLATEYSTGKVHKGRIDTLGIDENGCPVIIEYKRHRDENVMNQGLFYLDWLMDHKAEFELLTLKAFGKESAEAIEWSSPRLLCIAGDFTKYDEHAVQQINRNIELIRYRIYGEELLLLELVNAVSATETTTPAGKGAKKEYKTVTEFLAQADDKLKDLYDTLKDYLLALGDDAQIKTMKYYFAFKRIKNFACVEVITQGNKLKVFVKVDPETIDLETNKGFLRDVRNVGHFGTGSLEITIKDSTDLEKAKPYLQKSYEVS